MRDAAWSVGPRLPPSARYRILEGASGSLILRPWFDKVAQVLIPNWYFPISRAWAAALDSAGSLERFLGALYGPDADGALLRRLAGVVLGASEARRRAYDVSVGNWEQAFFGPGPASPAALVAAERARHGAAHRFMSARSLAVPLHARRRLPPVRFEIAPLAQAAAAHGHRLEAPQAAFPAPPPAEVESSRGVPAAHGTDHWLRFPAPVMGDTAWARVATPAPAERGRGGLASLIFLHGIAMETEMWRTLVDPSLALVRRGVRVIRPEGPWHGRRRPAGWFGGEPAMGHGALGFIELFQAWVAEVAVMVAWARRTSDGPVAVGGVSLGALTAQMVAAACRYWPAELRPDAVFLAATSGDLVGVIEDGSLSRALGMPARLRAAGWTAEALETWRPLLEPCGDPGLDPARIVMVLGRFDDLLPFAGGAALARRWRVPSQNIFVRPQGHFSVSLGLGSDQAPLERLAAVLGAGGAGGGKGKPK